MLKPLDWLKGARGITVLCAASHGRSMYLLIKTSIVYSDRSEASMKNAALFLILLAALSAVAKDKPVVLLDKYDAPLAAHLYYLSEGVHTRHGLATITLNPYLVQAANGQLYLRMGFVYSCALAQSCGITWVQFTGGPTIPYENHTGAYDYGYERLDLYGPEVENSMRRLVDGEEAWVVVGGDASRFDFRLRPDKLAAWRQLLEKYDSLVTSGHFSSAPPAAPVDDGSRMQPSAPTPAAVVPVAPVAPIAPIQPASSPSVQQATVEFWSRPAGASIELDGKYIGITPSTITVPAGQHSITIRKKGCTTWLKMIKVTSENVRVAAYMEEVRFTFNH
jgi:hypothetical protein